jgi:hypothetical protein
MALLPVQSGCATLNLQSASWNTVLAGTQLANAEMKQFPHCHPGILSSLTLLCYDTELAAELKIRQPYIDEHKKSN